MTFVDTVDIAFVNNLTSSSNMSWLFSSLPSIPSWSKPEDKPDGAGAESSMPGSFASTSDRTANGHAKPEDKNIEETEEDLDIPPPFPLPNSAQRSAPPPPVFALAPPSPPRSRSPSPPSDLNIAITDLPLGTMALPPSTTKKPNFGIKPGGFDMAPPSLPGSLSAASSGPVPARAGASTSASSSLGAGLSARGTASLPLADTTFAPTEVKKKGRGKVALAPGCSALDWARLSKSGANLRGIPPGPPLRVTMEELKKHNTPTDAWSAFNGVVFNLTPYLRFHPGGEDELMRVAGRDGTRLFMLTHSWVNMEHLMAECMVGMLVRG